MIVMTTVAIGGGTVGALAILYNFFKRDKTEEELNFEEDLSDLTIEKKYKMSNSCIIKPSLTPNSATKLPKNKVIIKNKI